MKIKNDVWWILAFFSVVLILGISVRINILHVKKVKSEFQFITDIQKIISSNQVCILINQKAIISNRSVILKKP